MSQLGLGVMINALCGYGSDDFSAFVGKEVSKMSLDGGVFRISFEGGGLLTVTDEGQSCCENRYMRTDDDLDYHKGATLLGIENGKAAEETEGEYGECHEICFVDVKTSRGVITLASHNEHNGYYGGFSMVVKVHTKPEASA